MQMARSRSVRSAVGARWRRPASELESADGRLLLGARSGGASGGWGGADEAAVGRERPDAAVAGRSGEASQRAAALVLHWRITGAVTRPVTNDIPLMRVTKPVMCYRRITGP